MPPPVSFKKNRAAVPYFNKAKQVLYFMVSLSRPSTMKRTGKERVLRSQAEDRRWLLPL